MRSYISLLALCVLACWAGAGCGHNAPASPPQTADASARTNISAYQQRRHGGIKNPTPASPTP